MSFALTNVNSCLSLSFINLRVALINSFNLYLSFAIFHIAYKKQYIILQNQKKGMYVAPSGHVLSFLQL